jgi:hypothetical protein
VSAVDNGDGTERVTISDTALIIEGQRKFIRIAVTEL